ISGIDGFGFYYTGYYGYYPSYDPIYTTYYQTDVSAGVSFLEGRGDGTFGPETDVITYSSTDTSTYAPSGANNAVSAVAVGNFDHNGTPDVAAVQNDGTIAMLINSSPLEQLQMAVSSASTTAGVTQSVTVSALDLAGNPDPAYTGTVHFSSSDYQGVLPADYTFTAADHGVHTFKINLETAGDQSLTIADYAAFASASTNLTVTPAAASTFSIGAPYQPTTGDTATYVIYAVDPYGNLATDYTGTVHFSSSDAAASLPGNYTFASADGGIQYFYATLRTAGSQTFTVTDTHAPSLPGQSPVDVLPVASLSG